MTPYAYVCSQMAKWRQAVKVSGNQTVDIILEKEKRGNPRLLFGNEHPVSIDSVRSNTREDSPAFFLFNTTAYSHIAHCFGYEILTRLLVSESTQHATTPVRLFATPAEPQMRNLIIFNAHLTALCD
jgi:hypothetical protein